MEHTKGEWKTYRNALGQWAVSTDLEPIAQVDRHYNAHLIAAAPDMYEALKELADIMEVVIEAPDVAQLDSFTLQPARQALAKAEGR